jgi:hypothetical protein
MDQSIDITMTATLRPVIAEEVMISIVERLCKNNVDRFNFFINVDPVGEDISPQVIVDIAKKHFPNVVHHIPDKPSFPLAVKWLWDQVSTKYVFHAEDDWKLVKDLDIDHMIDIMECHEKIASLRLCRGHIILVKEAGFRRKQWSDPVDDMDGISIKCDWHYHNDGFYLSPGGRGQFSMNPSLLRKDFIRPIVPFFDDGISPERVLMLSKLLWERWGKARAKKLKAHINNWTPAMLAIPLVLEDLGREWRRHHGFTKPKRYGIGTTWVKCASTK